MTTLGLGRQDHVVCIASGGCNMMSYLTARPASVTAVDLSPWHVELNRLKLEAAQRLPDHASFYALFGHADQAENVALLDRYVLPYLDPQARAFWNGRERFRRRKSMFARGFYRFGVLGTFLGAVHLVARIGGVDFTRLLGARTLEDQRAFFEDEIKPLYRSRLVRFAARRRASLFGLGIPPAQYDKLAADADGDIVTVLEERTRKLFCDFPIGENYFAWQAANRAYKEDGTGPVPPYLEKRNFEALRAAAGRATVLNRSITDVLAEAPAASKSVYVLLDAQDWMTDDQLASLWREITRTAMPGARVLFRTGGGPDILPGRVPAELLDQWAYDAPVSERAFAEDRSAIYGGVHLYRRKG
jgi:S-adenosylmethionine-diacylglycerol 3-amino-3-carboxypropyl transferase